IRKGVNKVIDINRYALSVLRRFELVTINNELVDLNNESIRKYGGTLEAIWSVAKNESSLIRCVEIITESPNISPKELASHISVEYELNWSEGSKTRNGRMLKQWAGWVKEGIETSNIPAC
ncbi:MAG: restriction endonuclease, partial [Gammaproteobacteria bacterium]|nr:restriction endonuclease [Gammaproteobacteria bacterium]